MRIGGSLFEITVMPGEITTVLPYDIDARIVHPAMIEAEIALHIHHAKRQDLAEPWDEARITDVGGFRRAARVALSAGQHVQLRMTAKRLHLRQPELRLLPQQCRLGQQHLSVMERNPFPDQACRKSAIVAVERKADRSLTGSEHFDRSAERGQPLLRGAGRHMKAQTFAVGDQAKGASGSIGGTNIDPIAA